MIHLDDREIRCPEGSFIYIPAGAVHGFRVGSQPRREPNLYVLEGMIGYFEALAAAVHAGTVDEEHRVHDFVPGKYGANPAV